MYIGIHWYVHWYVPWYVQYISHSMVTCVTKSQNVMVRKVFFTNLARSQLTLDKEAPGEFFMFIYLIPNNFI